MKEQVHSHVLSKFAADEMDEVAKVLGAVAKNFPLFWQKSPEMLATKVAEALNPPRPKPEKKEPTDGI